MQPASGSALGVTRPAASALETDREWPTGVVIPIRGFASGMARLAGALNDEDRVQLAITMAGRVVAAAGPLPIVIVSSAPEVHAWADAIQLRPFDP